MPKKDAAASDDTAQHDDAVLITREGLKKIQEELNELKTVRTKEIALRLKEAISYGDLSENSEYEEAKNEQAFVQGRILELENKVRNAQIISGAHTNIVKIGSVVTLRNITTRGEEETYTIVGSTEADPFSKKISNESPIGEALIDKTKGEKVKVAAPAGNFNFEIVALK
jgi:transcription elongation factor GreA